MSKREEPILVPTSLGTMLVIPHPCDGCPTPYAVWVPPRLAISTGQLTDIFGTRKEAKAYAYFVKHVHEKGFDPARDVDIMPNESWRRALLRAKDKRL